ncbi:hypothetical protein E4T66_17575 [Sinimarinibacterium sp. CAU 1509]|nr:hypothetical protein E4T66_17575 [Sinimarinibacterium sp. CAU 1509]
MGRIASLLAEREFVLRSGAARGADSAFEVGAGNSKEIFLPFERYNGHPSPLFQSHPEAEYFAGRHHPAWDRLDARTRQFMVRNAQIILGQDTLTPVAFVVCWTADGANGTSIPTTRDTGGTGHAIRVATEFGIPVVNLRAFDGGVDGCPASKK